MDNNKELYYKKLEAQINEYRAELDRLSARLQKETATARLSYRDRTEELGKKLDEAKRKLQGLKKTGDHTWSQVKEELDKGFGNFKDQFQDLVSALK